MGCLSEGQHGMYKNPFAYGPFVSTDCLCGPCNQGTTVGVKKHLSVSTAKEQHWFPNQPPWLRSRSWTLERIIATSKTAPKTISWIDTATPIKFTRLVIRPITNIAPSKPETDPRPQFRAVPPRVTAGVTHHWDIASAHRWRPQKTACPPAITHLLRSKCQPA